MQKAIPSTNLIKQIYRRDGILADFDPNKIIQAIEKAMTASLEGSREEALSVAQKVIASLENLTRAKGESYIPNVEQIQDLVENELILAGLPKTAKAYILYRSKRSEIRKKIGPIPDKVRNLVEESRKYFRSSLGEFVYYRTYSRWIEEEKRRETWIETVDRYMNFMKENLGAKLSSTEYDEVRKYILEQKTIPSMRLLQFAGPAARKSNVCAYNCSFIAPSKLSDFSEIMYILMCGSGVGFSVESQNVEALPQIKMQTGKKLPTHFVEDSREGWCDALKLAMKTWFDGKDIDFDYSLVRGPGERLKTMGGRSSGPEPLRQLMIFTRAKILKRQGRRLRTIDVHDIVCKIGEIVVSGGVRRSALISLSDLDDETMRDAKKGQFWLSEGQRFLANNSAAYNERPATGEFIEEWLALVKSGSGERGIFNRWSLKNTLPSRRLKKSAKYIGSFGTNPCGEIILRSRQFCNLSEVVARSEDTRETLLNKVRIATILGTYQATLTNFPYLSAEWKKNCEEERLLGVSITGQWDCPALRNTEVLSALKEEAIKANKSYAKRFGINQSACITCTKPSGTASQVLDCSAGMHPRFSPFYIRRIRISATDPLFKMLKDQGVPYHPEVGQAVETATTFVLEFPVRAPEGSVFNRDLTAIDQLEYWKMVKNNFTEHNPSITVYVGDDEWIEVADWVYRNWDIVGGLTFLPRDNHVYQLAPYEEIDEKRYLELVRKVEHIDFSKIITYEKEDETEVKKELACVAGICEIA
jgi:ribonucleoside-diphosphate reductase alpha chain